MCRDGKYLGQTMKKTGQWRKPENQEKTTTQVSWVTLGCPVFSTKQDYKNANICAFVIVSISLLCKICVFIYKENRPLVKCIQ